MEIVPGPPRLFTLEEANALLPEIRERLSAVQQRAAQLIELQARLAEFREQKRRGEHEVAGEAGLVQQVLGEASHIGEEIQDEVRQLLALGCELKDVQTGLVDFRARREDRIVYLCWKLGEDEIRFWHELDTGFAGRQPL